MDAKMVVASERKVEKGLSLPQRNYCKTLVLVVVFLVFQDGT